MNEPPKICPWCDVGEMEPVREPWRDRNRQDVISSWSCPVCGVRIPDYVMRRIEEGE